LTETVLTLCVGSVPTVDMLKENEKLREERTCKVCMDAEVNTVFLPCGHFVCCGECSQQLQTCPICRVCISGTVAASVSWIQPAFVQIHIVHIYWTGTCTAIW